MRNYKEGDYVVVSGYGKVYEVDTANGDGFVAVSTDGLNKVVAIYGRDTIRYATDEEEQTGFVIDEW